MKRAVRKAAFEHLLPIQQGHSKYKVVRHNAIRMQLYMIDPTTNPGDISLSVYFGQKPFAITEVTLEICMAQIFVHSASSMWTLYQHCCSVKSYWLFLGQGQSMRISSPHRWTCKSLQYYSSGHSCRLETG